MGPNVYCPFCGVILLPDPYFDKPEIPVRPWYAEVRGIYATDTPVSNIAITGLGLVWCRNRLNAPLDRN